MLAHSRFAKGERFGSQKPAAGLAMSNQFLWLTYLGPSVIFNSIFSVFLFDNFPLFHVSLFFFLFFLVEFLQSNLSSPILTIS